MIIGYEASMTVFWYFNQSTTENDYDNPVQFSDVSVDVVPSTYNDDL